MFTQSFFAKWAVLVFILSLLLSCGGGTSTSTTSSSDNSAPAAPAIGTFTATPSSVVNGAPTNVTWAWIYSNMPTPTPTCTINQNVGAVTNGTATSVTLTANTDFTLTCGNSAGNDTAQTTITIGGTPAPCTALGAATYNSGIITLSGGANTLCSIYKDINNPAVLSYDASTNTYTLNASIENVNDLAARPSLTIADTTLLVNSTVDDQYHINGGWILTITNSTIKSNNNTRYRIWAPSIYGTVCKYGACQSAGYYAAIDHAAIIGGWVYLRMDSDALPVSPYIRITNTTIKDIDTTGVQIPSETTYGSTNDDTSPLRFHGSVGYNALVENVTLDNVHGSGIYGGTIGLSGADNLTFRNIRIINSSAPNWGAIHSYPGSNDTVFENITISNRDGDGISYKEGPFGVMNYYKNILIENFTGIGFHTYAQMHPGLSGLGGARIENITIDGGPKKASFIFEHDYANIVNVWVFNAQLKNAVAGFRTRNNKYFSTNVLVQNIDKMYDMVFGSENGEVNWYELADIYVTDSNGNPINGATIQITPNTIAPVPNVVDKWFNAKTSIVTGPNGHIPLPSDETGTVALLRQRDYNSGYNTSTYSYTITATYNDKSATVSGVSPDSTWYRTDPLVPAPSGTVVLKIN